MLCKPNCRNVASIRIRAGKNRFKNFKSTSFHQNELTTAFLIQLRWDANGLIMEAKETCKES